MIASMQLVFSIDVSLSYSETNMFHCQMMKTNSQGIYINVMSSSQQTASQNRQTLGATQISNLH